jgi:Protein of unknown function (DUF3780)
MSKQIATIDFGAPEEFGAHLFQVIIPISKQEEVQILEYYGFKGGEGGLPDEELRVSLPRSVWSGLAEAARIDFNGRLKEKKMLTSRWKSGVNKVDRLLGKELCVLAWAAEKANSAQLPLICSKWTALRPEERWWLFSAVAAEGGLAESEHCGWRKALYYALSGEVSPSKPIKRQRRPQEDLESLPLFAWRGMA